MLGAAVNSDDFKGKKVSLQLTLLLLIIVAFAVYEGSYIYFEFERVKATQALIQELHEQDIKHLEERADYERERVDRKFKRLEDGH